MKLTIDGAQGVPSFTVVDDYQVILAKVYACKDGTVISTKNGNFRLPIGSRNMKDQVTDIKDVPKTDGFEV